MAINEVPLYTCNPISSAKGNTNKSPTAETVALPSSSDFAACSILAFKVQVNSVDSTYLLYGLLGHAIYCVCNAIDLRSFPTLNQSGTCQLKAGPGILSGF